MSYLNTLGIRGIRSFDPNQDAVIKFQRPLTVIVGENGCGKTTIIECLKYATTSTLPCQGSMFVHDPQISAVAEIKANVKLKFTTGNGQQYTSTQIMKVKRTQGKKGSRASSSGKKTFSTMDTVLTHHSRQGKDRHLNQKCATLADAVPKLLGVSKPILENVFFCHQEDSNWPMGSSRELQDKFNAIFQVTRYTKALSNIKDEIKFRKAAENKEKIAEAGLAGEVNQIKDWRKQKQRHQTELDRIETEREQVTQQLEVKRANLRVARDTAAQAQVLDQRLRELRGRCADEERMRDQALADRRTTIQPDGFTETRAEVEALSERNQSDMHGDGDIPDLQKQLAKAREDKERCERELQDLAGQRGKNEEQLRQQERVRADLDAFVEEVVANHDVDGTDAGDPADVVAALTRQLEHKRKQQAEHKVRRAQEQTVLEQKLVARQSAHATAMAGFDSLRKEKSEVKVKLTEFTGRRARAGPGGAQLASAASVAADLEKAEKSDQRVTEDLDKLNFDDAQRKANEELEQTGKAVRELEAEVQRLDVLLVRSQGQGELQALEARVAKEREHHDYLMSRLQKSLEGLGVSNVGADRLVEVYHSKVKELQERQVQSRQTVQARRDAMNGATHRRDQCALDLAAVRKKKNEAAATLKPAEECLRRNGARAGQELKDFPRVYDALKTRVADLRKQQVSAAGSQLVQTKVMRDLLQASLAKGRCQLCRRGVRHDADHEVAASMKKKQARVEEAIAAAEHAAAGPEVLEAAERDFNVLDGLKAAHACVVQAEDAEIPKREADLQRCKADLAAAGEDLEGATQALKQQEDELVKMQAPAKEVAELEFRMQTLKASDAELETAKFKAANDTASDGGADATPNTQSLQREREQVKTQLDQARKTQAEQQGKLAQLKADRDRLKTRGFELKDELFALRQRLAEAQAAEAENSKHLASLDRINEGLSKEDYEMSDLKKACDVEARRLAEFKGEADEVAKRAQQAANELQQTVARLQDKRRAAAEVGAHAQGDLEALTQAMAELKSQRDVLQKEATDLAQQLDKKKNMLDHKKSYQAALNADLRVKASEERIRDFRQKIQEAKEERDDMASREKIDKAVSKLEASCSKRETACTTMDGRAAEIRKMVRAVDRDLQRKHGKEEELSRVKINLKTIELAIKDLTVYRKAVEDSLMKYHAHRIRSINDVIKHLWHKTYKGNDITSIEIKADAAASSRSVSSFQYSLVMKKGSAEIDMRQRCSAGQKVLASLVIRLALADVYGMKCGVMALDEPTTNLDKRHKESLARALADIIETRSRLASNFQLILITHDRGFVDMLQQYQTQGGHRGDYYYTVERVREDGVYRSRIKRESYVYPDP